jgi:hypothetical protein
VTEKLLKLLTIQAPANMHMLRHAAGWRLALRAAEEARANRVSNHPENRPVVLISIAIVR